MFGLQNLCNVRIVGLNQCARLQIVAVESNPKGNHGDGHGDVFKDSPAEVQIAGGIFKVRLDEPKQIEGLGEDSPLADANQAVLVALDVARQQEREGYEPVEDEIERDDDAPMSANAIEIPANLL